MARPRGPIRAISPDGRWVAALRSDRWTPERIGDVRLMLVDLVSGEARDLAPGLDLWPHGPIWAPDGTSVYINADRRGNVAVFRIDIAADGKPGEPALLAADGENTCLTPTAESLFVLRSSYEHPAAPFRYDLTTREQQGDRIATFPELDEFEAPGILERLCTKASDGQEVWSWLVRPRDASPEKPAPLVVWVHGGPLGSWNGWHWRWNPHLLVERGYAVLHARPGLSTGYGHDYIRPRLGPLGRGALHRHDRGLDGALEPAATSTASAPALMGGSFGGYMANWVAGTPTASRPSSRTPRLWELRGFHGTTDFGPAWEQEFGDIVPRPVALPGRAPRDRCCEHPDADAGHPRRARPPRADQRGAAALDRPPRHGVEGQFLYFPDENHWS